MTPRLLALLAAACHATCAHGFDATRVSADSVRLDGRLTEPVWAEARAHERFFETQPADRIPAKFATEVRLVYDSQALYVAVRAADPDTAQLRAPFARRDRIGAEQDYVALYIDPAGNGEAAHLLYLNPRGAISDGAYSDSSGDDTAPDLDVEVATARFEGGWSAEVRIPFASLAYPNANPATWKLLVMRNMTREQRYRMFSAPVTRATNCNLCYAEPINGLRDLPSGLRWTATPQLTARATRESEPGWRRRERATEASLDAKLRLDSASTVDLTVNPDFSQVELDAPQLAANTRFGLFVQEKRPFFLEGSDLLQTPFRAINTRSITRPAWGVRYTRRSSAFDVALITARDDGGGLVLLPTPYYTGYAAQDTGSQASIARAVFRLGGVSVGTLASDRTLENGRGYNRVAGADFTWQRGDGDRLRGQLLYSATTAHPGADGRLAAGPRSNGHAAMLAWARAAQGWSINMEAQEVSRDFRADNGFFAQSGYRYLNTMLVDKRGAVGALRELNLYVFGERRNDSEGALILDNSSIGAWMAGPFDSELDLHVRPRSRTRVVEGGPVFETTRAGGRVAVTPGPVLARLSLEGEAGDQIDVEGARVGKGGNLALLARLRLSDRVEFEQSWSAGWANQRTSNERLYREQAAQAVGIVHFSARDTLRLIAQATRTRRNAAQYTHPVAARSTSTTASLVYGHTPSLGTAAYAGVTVSRGETPGYAPLRRANEVFLKLSFQI
jgi:hypothetical protein